jgi:hypothetical protein
VRTLRIPFDLPIFISSPIRFDADTPLIRQFPPEPNRKSQNPADHKFPMLIQEQLLSFLQEAGQTYFLFKFQDIRKNQPLTMGDSGPRM